jgi:hypothetical protein
METIVHSLYNVMLKRPYYSNVAQGIKEYVDDSNLCQFFMDMFSLDDSDYQVSAALQTVTQV